MKHRLLEPGLCSSLALSLFYAAVAPAAPVLDTASPTEFSAPTAAQLSDARNLSYTSGTLPQSIIEAIRSAPNDELNPGLDAPVPPIVDGADSMEVGVLVLPAPSHSCPAGTPVTIAYSDWSLTLVNASPGATGAGGGGSTLADTRDPTFAAPATAATASGVPNPATIGATNVVSGQQYVGTFADLPFLFFGASINVARIATATPVQSHYRASLPTLSLAYDDATCTPLASGGSVAVPTMGRLQLVLLILLLPVITLLGRRARFNPRK